MNRLAMLAVPVVIVVFAGAAEARPPSRARCRNVCATATSQCILGSPYRYRKALRLCRAGLVRKCRRSGESACDVVPTVTTTSSTTSSTRPIPVTTTIPVYPNYGGHWTFTGTLASDSCGSSYGLVDGFDISQAGASMTSTVDSVAGLVLSGGLTADGFTLDGAFIQGACAVEIALVVKASGEVVISAATGFDVDCGLGACRSIWVGTLTR